MIRVDCRTNLYLTGEKWPTLLPCVPRVGDIIRSGKPYNKFQLELQVVGVTYRMVDSLAMKEEWIPEIELHMTEWQKKLPCSVKGSEGSIRAFYEWYALRVGKTVGNFI